MEKIKYKINNLISKIHDYFLIEKSLNNLMNISVKYFVTSIDSNDIYYGDKNPKRFKTCVLIYVLMCLMTFGYISFILSDDMYSLIDSPFLPGHFRTMLLLTALSTIMILVAKTDIILGEIKFDLNQLKIFYYLINDVKSKHKLSEANYKKLTILSRIIQILIMNYALKFGITFGSVLIIKIAIEFKILVFQLGIIISTIPFLIICTFTAASFFLPLLFCFIIINCYLIKLVTILN